MRRGKRTSLKTRKLLEHKYNTRSIKKAIGNKNKLEAAKTKYVKLLKNSEYFCKSENFDDLTKEPETSQYIE